jgi:Protein of unknown function (DUF742)
MGPGPVVRPYALVRGRTRPIGKALDVIAMVSSLHAGGPDLDGLEPEHLAVLRQCAQPMSVAEVTCALDLPLGVVRILLGDLRDRALIRTDPPRAEPLADIRLLRAVLDGLRRL